jgi:thiol-disulfide isomerase/thioredoxin
VKYFTLLLFAVTVPGLAQEPSKTWPIAKPIVQGWAAEYAAGGRSNAARDKILAEIHSLLEQHPSDVWAYEAAVAGYNHLNRNEQALEVLRAYRRRFPNDSTLDERVLLFFGNWGTAEDLESLPARWQGQTDYWRRLVQVYARVKASPDKLKRAGDELLERIPQSNDPGGDERFSIAETWLAHGVDPHAAEPVAREAVAISEVGQPPPVQYKNQQEFLILKRLLIRNVNRSVLGWALYQEGRYQDALAELQRAGKIVEQNSLVTRAVYYRLGQTLERLGRPGEAIEAYYKELAWGDLEGPTKQALAVAYSQVHGSLAGMEVAERTRINDLAMQRANVDSDLVTAVDEDLGRFELLDEANQPLDLKRFRGKVVIVDFWATWCHVCLTSMRHTDEMQKRFGDKVVVIAPCGDPEETRPQAAEFLKRMNYDFILVFDDEKRRDIKLPYIPTCLLLDRNGRLRFMAFGYSPTSAALLERDVESLLGGGGG